MHRRSIPAALLPRFALLALLVASVSSCTLETLDPAACPTEGTKLSYDNFGKAFFLSYCDYCHSAEIGDRKGAPDSYDFSTREKIVAHKERIYQRSAGTNDSMPPGPDDPPLAEREQLAEWLNCGAP